MICKKEACTGCYACYNICPKNCISMEEDEFGFFRPTIQEENCIHCDLCRKICPANRQLLSFKEPMSAFAGWTLDDDLRTSSTSGGVATILASEVLDQGGAVFGAAIMDDLSVCHIQVTQKKGLARIKGSKYVQRKIGTIFSDVKSVLDNGKQALFIGTACQVSGLLSYLRKDYDRLITIDLVCHGVPSYRFFREYMDQQIDVQKVSKYTFRAGNNYTMTFYQGSKPIRQIPYRRNTYLVAFMKSLIQRPNCYTCPYANPKRVSDITLGDFWGLGDETPFLHDRKKGVSLLLINTQKGKQLLDCCRDQLFLEQREVEEAIKGNSQLRYPTPYSEKRKKFERLYLTIGFEKAVINCYRNTFIKFRIKRFLYRILGKPVDDLDKRL